MKSNTVSRGVKREKPKGVTYRTWSRAVHPNTDASASDRPDLSKSEMRKLAANINREDSHNRLRAIIRAVFTYATVLALLLAAMYLLTIYRP